MGSLGQVFRVMLIYIFVEHYPNPYKPYLDAQFADFLRRGHQIRIFAAGKYVDTVHEEVRTFELDRKTSYYPTTLKTLPRLTARLLVPLLLTPLQALTRIRAVHDSRSPAKQNLTRCARMLSFPLRAPDLCLIHNGNGR